MILPDHEIIKLCQPTREEPIHKDQYPSPMRTVPQVPMVDPFNPEQVEPASYDVRVGNHFKIFQRDATPVIDIRNVHDITRDVVIDDEGYFLMHPGEFALGRTQEVLRIPNNIVGRIEGKSSIGRLGLMIHITAGFIDPGFIGSITLEMFCVHPLPVMIWPNELIAQISFHEMKSAAAKPYQGRYQGATTVESSKFGQ